MQKEYVLCCELFYKPYRFNLLSRSKLRDQTSWQRRALSNASKHVFRHDLRNAFYVFFKHHPLTLLQKEKGDTAMLQNIFFRNE